MEWDRLRRLATLAKDRRIANLFRDTERARKFSVRAGDLLLDFSKTSIDDTTFGVLVDMAAASGLEAQREAMFSGARINQTENRAVLHTALRNLNGGPVMLDGRDVMPGVRATLEHMRRFAGDVRAGRFTGQGGRITDVVNIGIGGSDLGPAMAVRALAPCHDGPRCHFVSNVDGADIHDTLSGLVPETTLIIVASKTFTTVETMTNAEAARAWMAAGVGEPGAQFAAISAAGERAAAFGIAPGRVFGFGDWVGGRYSVWGPVGLSLMIAVGAEDFGAFLGGAEAMDRHFRTAPLAENMPVVLALVGIWHNQGCGYATRAVLPYDQRLARLPAYLQQLEMESNGKGVAMDGGPLPVPSGPVVWGEPGTNGQHAFYQLIHQGTRIIPCEFLVAAEGHEAALDHHHRLLVANCLAQSEALMLGRDPSAGGMAGAGPDGEALERQARHRAFPGNRPSTTLVYPKLTPYALGQIIALYEHRVFVEGALLGINSFDQWGVELGKALARDMEPLVLADHPAGHKDGSTRLLLEFVQACRGR